MGNFIQNRRWLLIATMTVGLIGITFGGYWVIKRDPGKTLRASAGRSTSPEVLPRMSNLPPKRERITPPPSYPPHAPVLQQVRMALRKGISPSEAVAFANKLPECPRRPDAAILLLDYAAESGNAVPALALGHYYDPAYSGPSGSIRKDPAIAYEWYQAALARGQKEAENHLAKLRRWGQKQAARSSGEAGNLLNGWR